jgi:hypothetical protein
VTTGIVDLPQLAIPLAGFLVTMAVFFLFFFKFRMPRYLKQCRTKPETLVAVNTTYRKNVWDRVRPKVEQLLAAAKFRDLFVGHAGNIRKLDRFSAKTLKQFYQKIS